MPRPSEVDLTDLDALPWRAVPMAGSNRGVEVVPLAGPDGHFTIVCRFPAGFERLTPGGYHASEEFLVLEGELQLEGESYRRGDLTVIPAEFLRTDMRAPGGAVALAWFAGPAEFLPADELGACTDVISSVTLPVDQPRFLSSEVAEWSLGDALVPVSVDAVVEVVTADLSRWERGADLTPAADALVRRGA